MRQTLKCYSCKDDFPREQVVSYASPGAKTMYNYCPKCLMEKQSRDRFSIKVCQIFGLKNPGPRIWTERKRLIETYGYTDDVIIDCLDYIYSIEKKKKLAESLFLVNPPTVERMMRWKRSKQTEANILAAAYTSTETREHVVSIQENKRHNKEILNADDFLEEE